jgi:hypothetical protein
MQRGDAQHRLARFASQLAAAAEIQLLLTDPR